LANIDHNILYIKQIYNSLTTSEVRLAEKYLLLSEAKENQVIYNDKVTSKKGSLSCNFFKDIGKFDEKYEKISIAEYLDKRYTANQRRNLGNRVLRKLHDFITLESNIEKIATDSFLKIQQFLTRNIAVLEVLLARRLYDEFIFFSKKLLAIADKYELFFEACMIQRLQMSFWIVRMKSAEFDRLQLEYIKRKNAADAIFEANMNVILIQQKLNEKIKFDENIDYLASIISDMEINNIKSDTWNIAFNYLKLEYFQQKKLYSEGEKICNKILEIYNRKPFLSTKNTIGIIYAQISNNQLQNLEFNKAIESANKAIKYFKIGFLNYIAVSEILFLSYYYLNDLDSAYKIVYEIMQYNNVKSNSMYLARWNYYRAILLFKNEKYKEAYFAFLDCSELDKDKEGWGIGLRIFIIMTFIHRNLFDNLDAQLENLRKFISKLKQQKILRKRYQIIYKILKKSSKYDYDFASVDLNKELLLLNSSDVEYAWEVRSSELIRFEEWVNKVMY